MSVSSDPQEKQFAPNQSELAAKIRCLDKFLAEVLQGKFDVYVNEWEQRFIFNLKDWFDVKKLRATKKQAAQIERIFNLCEGLTNDFNFDWTAYVRDT